MSQETHRRLAAIVAADVVAYSRLMEADEAGTLATMRAHRRDLWAPVVKKYGGRIVGGAGDSILIEYSSAVAAVESSVEVQLGMAERNAGLAEDQKMLLRVGINIGEVIVADDDIFGDGVNIAARLQALADPGGIALSDKVRNEICGRMLVRLKDSGEQYVKNITEPLRVWRWAQGQGDAGDLPVEMSKADASDSFPSILVLPFENMSGDPEQEFFTDGITEDLLTELARFHGLIVISRTTSFAFKGSSLSVPELARKAGAKYVVEGSVRKAGNRLRITVQLIDAATDNHIWAEKYDRDIEDIFDIQDEVTRAIASVVPGRLEAAAQKTASRKPPENMAAFEAVITGKVLHHRSNPEDNKRALALLDKAIALDPGYAHAHAWRGCVLGQAWANGYVEDRDALIPIIKDELHEALVLDENDSDVHRILAAVNLIYQDHDRAAFHQERAVTLNPNDDLIVVQQGEILTWLGQPEEGAEWILKAMRLNPFHPERFWGHLGRAHFCAGKYAEALEAYRHVGAPNHVMLAWKAACAQMAGEPDAASQAMSGALEQMPGFTIAEMRGATHFRSEETWEILARALADSGLPEGEVAA
jgi:adenylate cyclase